MAARVVTLAPGVHRIPTMGDFINSYAFTESDGSVTLIDCGTKRAPAAIVRALAAMGKHANDVQRIVLTHAHSDHAGGAAAMLDTSAAPGVSAHRDEVEYLTAGRRPPLDPNAPAVGIFSRLIRGGFAPVPVVDPFADGDLLPVGGGVRVHHTPGHTPGHVSLLHEESGVLITGDAIFNMRSKMSWPVAAFCTSVPLNKQSAAVFADLDYRIAAFTHGPEIRDGAREAVRGFLRKNA
jgi:glyoxylase-like metal-dependent hydrolase (beta-lactamase superfamily II)